MSRFKLFASGRLRAVEDTFQVPDSKGLGITFTLLMQSSREYREFVEKGLREDPIQSAVMTSIFVDAMSKKQRARPAVDAQGVIDVTPDEDKASESLVIGEQQYFAILIGKLEKGEVSPFDIVNGNVKQQLESAVRLVKGWSGPAVTDQETGEPIPCTPDAVRELLTAPDTFPEGDADEGLTVGDVLIPWIHEQTKARAQLRAKVLEEAGKTSAPSSAGS